MIGETPGLSPEETGQENLEKNDFGNSENTPSQLPRDEDDKAKELKEKLRTAIEDPGEFRKLAGTEAVKEGGRDISETVESFHEKYKQWPGQEDEDRQINEYLGNGEGSIWQAKTLEAYKTMFPEVPLEQDKWNRAAKIVKRELRDVRLEEYGRHEAFASNDIEDKKSVELSPTPEKIASIRVNSETRARDDRPNNNEDSILVNHEKQLYGVFDGVGGHEGGEQASKEAAMLIDSALGTEFSDINHVKESLARAVEKADEELKTRNVGLTTATVAKIWEKNDQLALIYANVGDSRLFVFRGGKLNQLTVDDSVAELMVQAGTITKEQAELVDQAVLKEALADDRSRNLFARRNQITQSLGSGQNASVEVGIFYLKEGDRIIMTSDGIHDNLPKEQIETTMSTAPKEPAKALVENAYRYSKGENFRSKRDDMSAVVLDVHPFNDHFTDFPEKASKKD